VLRPVEPATSVGVWAVSSRLQPLPVLAKRFLTAVGTVLRDGPGHQI
jgi:hypothetical protein